MTNPVTPIQVVFLPHIKEDNDSRRNVSCPYCNEEFDLHKFFEFGDHAGQQHSEIIDGRKIYKCPRQHCSNVFNSLIDVVRHVRKLSELDNVKKMLAEQLEQDSQNQAVNHFAPSPSSKAGTDTEEQRHFSCNQCRLITFDWNQFFDHCWEVHGCTDGLTLSDSVGQIWLTIPPPAVSEDDQTEFLPSNSELEFVTVEQEIQEFCPRLETPSASVEEPSGERASEALSASTHDESEQVETDGVSVNQPAQQDVSEFSNQDQLETTSASVETQSQHAMNTECKDFPQVSTSDISYINRAVPHGYDYQTSAPPQNSNISTGYALNPQLGCSNLIGIPANSEMFNEPQIQNTNHGYGYGLLPTGSTWYPPYTYSTPETNLPAEFSHISIGGLYGSRIVKTTPWNSANHATSTTVNQETESTACQTENMPIKDNQNEAVNSNEVTPSVEAL